MEDKNQNTSVIFPDDGTSQASSPVVRQNSVSPQALFLEPQYQDNGSVNPRAIANDNDVTAKKSNVFLRLAKRADVILVALLILGGSGLALMSFAQKKPVTGSISSRFDTTSISLEQFKTNKEGINFGTQSVVVNGSLQANDGLIIAPSQQPASATAGQLYYDQTGNVLSYYNGTEFVSLGASAAHSVGGLTGQITLGSGLSTSGGQLSNSGVLSVQGLTGDVSFSAGSGIGISGATISNTGVVSVAAASGSPITVSNDGNGNITLGGAGSGSVTSSGGTAGRIALFTGSQNIENSIVTQSGLTVTVTGDLAVVTGGITLSNALTVSNGGTGASSLALNGVLIGQGTGAITSVTSGSAGLCLISTAGAPTWGSCTSGAVVSLDGLTGVLTIANSSGSGSIVTIDNASTIAKGIAQFNSTNFSVSSGTVNTIQNIDSASSPTFAGLNTNNIIPSSTLTVGATGQQLVLQGNASTQLTATGGGFTTTVGFTGSPTGSVVYNFNRATSAGTYEICSSSGNCAGTGGNVGGSGTQNLLAKFTTTGSTIGDSTITDNGVTVTTSVDLVVQGGDITIGVPSTQTGSIVLAHSGSANTGTITQSSLTANRAYTLPDFSGEICLSIGNCSGSGSANTLQAAYAAGNSITTSDARDIDIVLANTATDSLFDIVVADDSTGYVSVSRADGTGTNDPAQLILVDNLDINRALPIGIKLQAAGGGLTTAIDATDAEIVDALSVGANNIVGTTGNIDFTNFDVVGSSGNVTSAGNINLSGGGVYQVSGSQISSANLSNDSNLAKLDATQTFTGGTNVFRNTSNSTSSVAVQNAAGNNILNIDTTNGELELGTASSFSGRLVFNNVSNANTVSIIPGTPSASRTITLPDSSGIICLDSGNCAGSGATLQTAYNFSTGGTTPKIKVTSGLGSLDIQDADTTIAGDLFDIRASNSLGLGSVMFGVDSTGKVTLQNSSNSTTALRVLTAGGTSVLTVDTTNGQTLLGQSGTLAGNLIFRNASNSNTGTLTVAAVGQNTTYTLPDPAASSAEICLSTGNCLGGAGGGANTALSNLSSVAINTTLLPGSAAGINIGSATLPVGEIYVAGTSLTPGTNNFLITGASTSGTRTITLPDETGTVCLQNSSNCGFATGSGSAFIQGGNSFAATAVLGTNDANSIDIRTNSSTVASLSATGEALFKNSTDSTAGFQVQRASGIAAFTVDTSNSKVDINLTSSTAFRVQDAAGTLTPLTVNTTGAPAVQLYASAAASTSTTDSSWLRAPKGAVAVFVGDNDSTTLYGANEVSGNIRFNGTGVAWGDFGYYPQGGGNGSNGQFRLSTTGSAISSTPNAKLGIGGLYVNGNAGIGTNDPSTFRLSVSSTLTSVALFSGSQSSALINLQNSGSSGNSEAIGTTGNNIVLYTEGSEKLRIGSTGVATILGGQTLDLTTNGGTSVNNLSIGPGTETADSGTGATLALQGGNQSGLTSTGGSVTIQGGTGTSTNGSINIGVSNTAAISLGASGVTTTVNGPLTVSGAATSLTGATSGDALTVSNSTSVGSIAVFKDNSTTVLTIADGGAITAQNSSNSTTAFRILNGSSVPLFQVDTTNNRVYVGNPTGDTTGALLVLDTKTDSGDPTGANGGMYYNSNAGKFRCYENGAWKNCLGFSQNLVIYGANGNGAASQWSNMPAALTEIFGADVPSPSSRILYDLTDASEVRFQVNVAQVGATNAELRIQYSTDQSTWNYLDSGDTGLGQNISTTGFKSSSWSTIASGAKGDVYLRSVGISGDATTDPRFGLVQVQVR